MGIQLSLPKGAQPHPQFSAHVHCDQTAGWIKMRLDMEVGLGQSDFVLDRDPALHPKKETRRHPQFSAHVFCGQTAGWIKMSLGTEVDLGQGDFVLDGNPAPPPQEKGAQPPNFRPMSIVAKRLDGSRCHLAGR